MDTYLKLPFLLYDFLKAVYNDINNEKIDKENKNIPILLIHGNGSNKHQWKYFMDALSLNKDIGNIYYMNLNKSKFSNDNNIDMNYFIDNIDKKVKEIAEIQKTSDLIMIGHSMGGLAAAEYICSGKANIVKLITISTPWRGSKLADTILSDDFPNYYFKTNSVIRDKLTSKLAYMKNLNVYIY